MPFLVKYVCAEKIDSETRLNAAIDFLTKLPPNNKISDINIAEFESSCGVGVVVTPAQIEEAIEEEIKKVTVYSFLFVLAFGIYIFFGSETGSESGSKLDFTL